ncbi:alpha-1,3-mannosyl-glycoprotein 4-beta-N-acetylglucosaminyltransferase B isoform X2 [Nilaparvata lugens]|nr:alpha-1,3-mannosyl-glycoprotein 4-beta-N-acetylglucosaminyltransferase B isoform X2 [Nilaparvata lugens]
MAMSLVSPLRRRHVLFGLLLVFLPCSLFIIVSGPDMRQEQALVQRLAELQLKLQQLDSTYKAREEDVYLLGQQLGQLLADPATAANASAELRLLLLRNVTGLRPNAGGDSSQLLRLPSTYHFVPHLLLNPSSLRPAYALSKGRQGVSVALGVPTVKREDQSYLIATLQNLLEAMSQEEEDDSLIVVFIAETDEEYILQVANDIKQHFEKEIECGLIEVIAPSPSYYPDLTQLRATLGDSPERVRWRSKQNLDFAYLMMYSQPKAVFYVQLEDDILAKPHFLTTMKVTAYEKIANKQPWFVLDFCQLGFIGKMFRCVELPWLVQFFFMFYNDKPVDWLLDHMIYSKVCNLEKDNAACRKAKDELWVHCKPSLFQHIGTQSSLKGKVQKLKDKQFGKVKLYFPHVNPEATVMSTMNAYKLYTLKRAYAGETFFWGLLPQAGDHLHFKFKKPLFIKKYLFKSGNAEHPSDRFYNATVEVLPVVPIPQADNITTDGYIVVGKFDIKGMAEGSVNRKLGAIQELRLTIHSDSDNWAILSEMHIQPDDVR